MIDDAHRHLRESLGSHALGQLDPDERGEVQAHLDGCPGCRDTLAEIEPLAEPLRLVDANRMREPVRPTYRRRVSRWTLMAAVAALVGSGIGYAITPKPPELPVESVAVRVSAPSVESTAEVVPHTWGMEIKLAGSGFDPGLAYRVFVRSRRPGGQRRGVRRHGTGDPCTATSTRRYCAPMPSDSGSWTKTVKRS